jgi:uncharacterized protein (DUF2147 family)
MRYANSLIITKRALAMLSSKKYLLLILTALLFMPLSLMAADAPTVLGSWKTIDDESGKAKSIVTLFERDGKVFGRIDKLLLKPADTRCKKCEGDLKDQLVVGMEILTDMQADGDEYAGGEILDPEKGKFYSCKIWLEDANTLNVRGYIGFLFRTQTWHRVEAAAN